MLLDMSSAIERRNYVVTATLTGWAHTQNDRYNRDQYLKQLVVISILIGILDIASENTNVQRIHNLIDDKSSLVQVMFDSPGDTP